MPTRTEYINYVHSTCGPKRRRGRENDVHDNEWYYGHVVWGENYSWCLVKECHDMNHFGILALNGGKAAYVPNMPGIARRVGAKVWIKPKRGSEAYQPGNRIGFDFNHSDRGSGTDAEHTGTYWKPRDASTFYSIDGNTGVDEVAVRIRYYRDVLFVVETLGLTGGSDTQEDDMQPSDQLTIGDWMKKHWSTDKTITDGKIAVNTALGSGYGHARAAHEGVDELKTMVAAQSAVLNTLADAVKASAPDIEALKQTIKDELSKVTVHLDVDDESDDT
jgi:hypothetical protein